MTIAEKSMVLNGRRVHYLESQPDGANAHPVVLLHGWGASAALMKPVMERLKRSGHPTIAPDFPGFGDSEAPETAWTVFDYANWTADFLDTLNLSRVNLIGHSFGGRISLILGADYADRVHRIVLVDAAGVPPRRSLWSRTRLAVYKSVRGLLRRVGAGGYADRLAAWYGKRYGSADYQNTSGVMRQTFIHVVNQDLRDHAARVSAPTLLIWGDGDQDTPLWQAKILESLIPDAGLVVLEGAGHYSYLDRLNEFVQITEHFFSS